MVHRVTISSLRGSCIIIDEQLGKQSEIKVGPMHVLDYYYTLPLTQAVEGWLLRSSSIGVQ